MWISRAALFPERLARRWDCCLFSTCCIQVRKGVGRNHRHPPCPAITVEGNLWGNSHDLLLSIRVDLLPPSGGGGVTVTSSHPLSYAM